MPFAPQNRPPSWRTSHQETGRSGVRLTLRDVRAALDVESPGARDVKRVGHNRFTYQAADGARVFRYIGTDIARLDALGVVTLNDGGFPTISTRKAWGDALAAFGAPGSGVYGGRHLRGRKAFKAIDAAHVVNAPCGRAYAFASPCAFAVQGGTLQPLARQPALPLA